MTQNNKSIIDTSALIALLNKEPGYKVVEEIIANGAMSSVNLAEFVSVLTRAGIKEKDIDAITKDIVPEIIEFTDSIAIEAGKLYKITKNHGLSLGDRACIATGLQHNMAIYTADKAWASIQSITVKIALVR